MAPSRFPIQAPYRACARNRVRPGPSPPSWKSRSDKGQATYFHRLKPHVIVVCAVQEDRGFQHARAVIRLAVIGPVAGRWLFLQHLGHLQPVALLKIWLEHMFHDSSARDGSSAPLDRAIMVTSDSIWFVAHGPKFVGTARHARRHSDSRSGRRPWRILQWQTLTSTMGRTSPPASFLSGCAIADSYHAPERFDRARNSPPMENWPTCYASPPRHLPIGARRRCVRDGTSSGANFQSKEPIWR